jgi:hypothetical protein
MKKFLFAIGALALGLTATAPAHADFAIVKFKSGYCRIWADTVVAPPDGTFVWFVWGHHRYYPCRTWLSPSTNYTTSSLDICAGTGETRPPVLGDRFSDPW